MGRLRSAHDRARASANHRASGDRPARPVVFRALPAGRQDRVGWCQESDRPAHRDRFFWYRGREVQIRRHADFGRGSAPPAHEFRACRVLMLATVSRRLMPKVRSTEFYTCGYLSAEVMVEIRLSMIGNRMNNNESDPRGGLKLDCNSRIRLSFFWRSRRVTPNPILEIVRCGETS